MHAEIARLNDALGTLGKQLAVALAAIQELIRYVAAKEGLNDG